MGGLELVKVKVPVAPCLDLVAVAAKIRDPGMSYAAEPIKFVVAVRPTVFEELKDALLVGHGLSFQELAQIWTNTQRRRRRITPLPRLLRRRLSTLRVRHPGSEREVWMPG